MPANLTPQYHKAEAKYKAAKDPAQKLEALKEMLSLMPKHKGTDKLHADLKRRLSKLNDELQQAKKKKGAAGASAYDHVEREGAGQVALVGLPNTGKSTLLNLLTHAKSEVAEYPFSTLKPAVGMTQFEDAQIQLIDLPPIAAQYTEPWVYSLIRNADRLCVLLDLSSGHLEDDWLDTLSLLEAAKLRLVGGKRGEAFGPGAGAQKAFILGTKSDRADLETMAQFEALLAEEFQYLILNHKAPLDGLKRALYELLDVVRIYSKEPGKPADLAQPFVLKKGSTTLDLAGAIHKDLVARLKYACVWGSAQFDGQRVSHDFVLQDKDIVEVHA